MPVSPTYPGVYIQEKPSGVRTITGVATSIAAFFGRAQKGPINKAVRILSLSDFERKFGEPHPKSDLGYSVRQFFNNGGADCHVVRLAHGPRKARLTLLDINSRNMFVLSAKSHGSWGNGIRIEVDYNTTNPDETFNLIVIQQENGKEVARETHSRLSADPGSPRFMPAFVSQSSDLIDISLHPDAQPGGASDIAVYTPGTSIDGFSQSRVFQTQPIGPFRTEFAGILTSGPHFEINVDDTQYVPIDLTGILGGPSPAITGTTWTLDEMADEIALMINTQLTAAVPTVRVTCRWSPVTSVSSNFRALRIVSDSGSGTIAGDQRTSVRIRRAATGDYAGPMMFGIDQGGIEVNRYSGFRPVPTAAFFHDVDDIVSLGGLARDAIGSIQIDGVSPAVSFDFTSMTPSNTDPWFLDSNGTFDGIREKLRAIVQAVNADATLAYTAELWGYHLALLAKGGSMNATVTGIVSATDTTLGGANFTRNVRRYSLGVVSGTGSYQLAGTAGIDDGDDGTVPQLSDFSGSETTKTGFHALDDVDLFNLMIIPGDEEIPAATHASIWAPASTYCEKHRAFLLMDAPVSWTTNGLPSVKSNTSLIDSFRIGSVKKNSAVFYPRLKYNRDGLMKYIGASGAIAGLMARTDAGRGVWKAPAGIEADIRNVSGLDVKLTDMENGVLNKKGVNCLRVFPNGIVNWGARTMDGDDDFGSEWKYIPVRRLALNIEESLYRGTRWVVFEPNDEPLWAKIRLNIGAYMMSLFRQGAFQGSGPKEAFFVKCDKETTTQDDINKGIVNIQVGFAPLKPAEFVIITIQQMAGDL